MPLNILIADDHSIVRFGISLKIQKIKPEAKVYMASHYKEVLEAVRNHTFNFIIIDINMPNGSFQSTVNVIKQKSRNTKVLAFSTMNDRLFAVRILKQGADGFLNKLSTEREIESALHTLFETGSYLSDEFKQDLILHSLHGNGMSQEPLERLTDREMEIAGFLVKGDSLKEIALQLHIHVSTVSTYKTRIFHKTKVRTLPELIELFRLHNNVDG